MADNYNDIVANMLIFNVFDVSIAPTAFWRGLQPKDGAKAEIQESAIAEIRQTAASHPQSPLGASRSLRRSQHVNTSLS